MEFDTKEDVYSYLHDKVSALKHLDPLSQNAVKSEVSSLFQHMDLPQMPNGAMGMLVPRFYWVIRNEDLPIVESLINGFATAATVGFFALGTADQNKLIGAAAGLIATSYKFCKSLAGKGKFVSQLDYKILLCLKNNPGGLDQLRLVNLMNLTKETVTIQQLEERVKTLQSIHTEDGSKRALLFVEDNLYKVRGI